MELQCIETLESLEPDHSPQQLHSQQLHSQQLYSPTPTPTLSVPSSDQSCHSPYFLTLPNSSQQTLLTSASPLSPHSPLTITHTPPSPPPKRRRTSYTSYTPNLTNPANNSKLPSTHPLPTLISHDLPHTLPHNHLAHSIVTPQAREEVIHWLHDMTKSLSLPPAICAVSIHLFDSFVIRRRVTKAVFYPLVAACLLIACKHHLDNYIPIPDIAQRARVPWAEIAKMEILVLNVLRWRIMIITPSHVVNELCNYFDYPHHFYQPFLDDLLLMAMLDYRLTGLRPSSVAVACFTLASRYVYPTNASIEQSTIMHLAVQCAVEMDEVKLALDRLAALFENADHHASGLLPRIPTELCSP